MYMVLFINNYEFDAEKLERALSSLIDIIFSIRWIQYLHKYEVIELLCLSRHSSSTKIMSTRDIGYILLFIYSVGGHMPYIVMLTLHKRVKTF